MAVESVTTEMIEQWIAGVPGAVRTRNKRLIMLHGLLRRACKAYGLAGNAAAKVDKFPQRPSGEIELFSPEEAPASLWGGCVGARR
jgi:hypothetical protein